MKAFILSLLALFFTTILTAQIQFDTISVLPAGPGMIHTKLVAPTIPWTINVFAIDLTNPYVSLETVKAQDRLSGYERTSLMAARRSYPGHLAIGAVNGDFYASGGVPTGVQVVNGEVLRLPINRSVFGVTSEGAPILRILTFAGTVGTQGNVRAVSGVNQARGTDALVVFNGFFGASTSTNAFGAEALVNPLGSWIVNDTVLCVVENVVNGVGNMSIPSGKAVLSGHGASRTFLANYVHTGDTIKMFLGLNPALPRLKEAIGGFPKIVLNGQDHVDQGVIEEGGGPSANDRHPRTGVGFNADSSRLYLITVDGRQTISAGMTLHELATLMIGQGIHTGINLDGGGSTTMVVRGVIANSPSDGGGERSVANALLAISSAPIDTLNRVILAPRMYRMYRGESFTFALVGVDRYGNPIDLNPGEIQYQVPLGFGTVDSVGRFTAGTTSDSGFVFVQYHHFVDSAYIVVKSINRIILSPQDVVTDTSRPVVFRVTAFDPDGIERGLSLNDLDWTSTDPFVGTLDTNGVFRGWSPGMTQVIGDYVGAKDTSVVTVQIGVGEVLLDSMESLQGWTLSGVNIDSTATTLSLASGIATMGTHSLEVNYRFVYDPALTYFVGLNTDIPIFGVPDSLHLDVLADSTQHRVIYHVRDDNNERFRFYSNRFVIPAPSFDMLRTPLNNPIPGSTVSFFNYPLRLTKIEVQLGSSRIPGHTYNGTLCFDNLRLSYPARVTSVRLPGEVPSETFLLQNYPNPFNPATTIEFHLAKSGLVSLKVFDTLGREVSVLLNQKMTPGRYYVEWNAAGNASGVYFYRLETAGVLQVRKLLLLK